MLAGIAVDAVFDSVSVVTTFREKLKKQALFSALFQKRSQISRLIKSTLVASYRQKTTISLHLTALCLQMVHLSTSPKVLVVQWSYQLTSVLTSKIRAV